ncbi:hypothetical protein HU200_000822 [Digitaria exilis]|uniref:Uncharacterized protein n=1 Tax=Digitaria exilis TaxID=1010633 RepID=A0A835G1W4_9POAL|nr:hypothetical protein HU200_000822 [Digitaria exilis]
MASASRALLHARFRTLLAYGVVHRPLAAAPSLLLPSGSTAKAAVMCLATRRATSSSLLSSSRPHKETVAIGDAMDSVSDGDSEEMSSEDERSNDEDTSSFSDDGSGFGVGSGDSPWSVLEGRPGAAGHPSGGREVGRRWRRRCRLSQVGAGAMTAMEVVEVVEGATAWKVPTRGPHGWGGDVEKEGQRKIKVYVLANA